MSAKKIHVILLIGFLMLFAWSAYKPYSYGTWALEVFPAVFGLIILVVIYRRWRFSLLAYVLMWLHAAILVVGGHYTYARVPLGNWVKDWLDLERNHFDRLGHVAQGFVPAIIIREVLKRNEVVKSEGWLSVIAVSIALAISAGYEFFEWWVAVLTGTAATDFLATQGDVWDTQWDMFLAMLGAIAAVTLLRRAHDRSMAQVMLLPTHEKTN